VTIPLRQLERNVLSTLVQAVEAGRSDPDHLAELGGNAAMLLRQLQDAGGLAQLVDQARTAEQGGAPR
jgi:hypothetical protein